MKQMQAAGSDEAEMETESPGGISETFHSKPLFSLLKFILSLLPRPSAPTALTTILVVNLLVSLSHSIYMVSFVCMIIVSQILSDEWYISRIMLPSLEHKA